MLFIIAILAVVAASIVYFNAKKRANRQESSLALVALVVAAFIGLLQCWTIIPAGHVGVIDFFGNVSDQTLLPGVNFVNPMANVVKFDARTQEMKEVMTVPSKEGLTIDLEISLLYSLSSENANKIYKSVGEDYVEKILAPQFRSVVRGVTASYDARALYTAEREELAKKIEQEISNLVKPRGITIEAAPLRQLTLPARLTESIEAKGISDFQDIVSKGISDQLLRWKGIEATEKLASSNNTKIVVIGAGKDGLPLILGGN